MGSGRRRRTKLGYDPIAVGNQHDFASGRHPDVSLRLFLNSLIPTYLMP
jgi:hypothetical protein